MCGFSIVHFSLGLHPTSRFLLYDALISIVLLAPLFFAVVGERIDVIAQRLGFEGVDQHRLKVAASVFVIVHAVEAVLGAAAAVRS